MDRLPDEMLMEIFLAYPHYHQWSAQHERINLRKERTISYPYSQKRVPWVFAHVCRRWRSVAFSTPRLWRHLPPIDLERPLEDNTGLLQHLSLSKSQPLSFYIRDGAQESAQEVWRLLGENASRWQDAFVHVPPRNLFPDLNLSQLAKDFSSLRTCHLVYDRPLILSSDIFAHATHLEELSLLIEGPVFSSQPTFPSSLRKFHSYYRGYRTTLDLLASVPQLVECNFSNSRFNIEALQAPSDHLVLEMPNLVSLQLGFVSAHDHLMACLTLPSLENLDISFKKVEGAQDKFPEIIGMLSRSSPRLKRLAFEFDFQTAPSAKTLRELLALTPDLEFLRWNNHFPICENEILAIFDDPTLVPQLSTLIFDSVQYNYQGYYLDQEIIKRVVARRTDAGGVQLNTDSGRTAALTYLAIRTRSIKPQEKDGVIPEAAVQGDIAEGFNAVFGLQSLLEKPLHERTSASDFQLTEKLEWLTAHYKEIPIQAVLTSELHLVLLKLMLRGPSQRRIECDWIPAAQIIVDYWRKETREHLHGERWVEYHDDLYWVAEGQMDFYNMLWDLAPPVYPRVPAMRRKMPMEWVHTRGVEREWPKLDWEYAELPTCSYTAPLSRPVTERVKQSLTSMLSHAELILNFYLSDYLFGFEL